MKKLIYYIVIIGIITAVINCQYNNIRNLKSEISKYQDNVEALLADVTKYQTECGYNAAKVGNLTLMLSDYEKYRSKDLELIKTLQVKNQNLQKVTTAQLESIKEFILPSRDSIVYLPGDTIPIVLHCIDYSDNWIDFNGCILNNTFSGKITTRDSLLIVESVQYKRFLNFLWKTKRIKNREFNIVTKNPNTKITGFEVITIEK